MLLHMELSLALWDIEGARAEAVFNLFWPAAIVGSLANSQPQPPDMSQELESDDFSSQPPATPARAEMGCKERLETFPNPL